MNVHFSSKTDMWETPQRVFDALNDEFGFELDVCATPENAKCARFFTKEIDGLSQSWGGIVWMNTPYGREIGRWIKKAHEAAQGGGDSCLSSPIKNRHEVVARILPWSRSSLHQGEIEIWELQERSPISERNRNL